MISEEDKKLTKTDEGGGLPTLQSTFIHFILRHYTVREYFSNKPKDKIISILIYILETKEENILKVEPVFCLINSLFIHYMHIQGRKVLSPKLSAGVFVDRRLAVTTLIAHKTITKSHKESRWQNASLTN